MTISTDESRPLRATPPPSVRACRALIGVQGSLATATTALAGFAVIYIAPVTLTADGLQHSFLVPVLLVGAAVLLSFVALAALRRFAAGEGHVRRTIIGVELGLAGSLVAFLVTSSGPEPLVWAAPVLDLACCAIVVGLLLTPTVRDWAEVPS